MEIWRHADKVGSARRYIGTEELLRILEEDNKQSLFGREVRIFTLTLKPVFFSLLQNASKILCKCSQQENQEGCIEILLRDYNIYNIQYIYGHVNIYFAISMRLHNVQISIDIHMSRMS